MEEEGGDMGGVRSDPAALVATVGQEAVQEAQEECRQAEGEVEEEGGEMGEEVLCLELCNCIVRRRVGSAVRDVF